MNSTEVERVRRHTSKRSNERIDHAIADTIKAHAGESDAVLTRRLDELDREWDVDRTLQTAAATMALTTATLGLRVNRRWLVLTGGILGFLLLHGTRGWCPPLPVLRRLGVRTRAEIDRERFALKFLRGDFDLARTADGRINLPALIHAVKT